jgi:hypothetical protein
MGQMLRVENNFEEVLSLRRTSARNDPLVLPDVRRLEDAITETFFQMNMAFAARTNFEFSESVDRWVEMYLAQFDAIFTLNQDLLLELRYGRNLSGRSRWRACVFPGAPLPSDWHDPLTSIEKKCRNTVVVTSPGRADDHHQPIFKLHGSVNWRTKAGDPVIVIGTGKEDAINGSDILTAYQNQFRQCLREGDTRLMVMGYSFSDDHINKLLLEGADHGLKMFLVNPAGVDAFTGPKGGRVPRDNPLLSKIHLVGVCTRPLATIFGDEDDPTLTSFRRFVEGR